MRFWGKAKIFVKYILVRPKRLVNFILIHKSKFLRLTTVLGRPITAMIEPVNYCNLKCPLCPTGMGLIKRKKESLSFENFKEILDNAGDSVYHLRLWNWGEPLLNKDIPKMIKYAKSKRMFVNTSTNSSFLDDKIVEELIKSGLDQLIVSLDGASEETYNKYRKNGNFKKVISVLKRASELKQRLKTRYPEIKIQFIVMRHNEHEMGKMINLAKKVGANTLFFKTVGVMDVRLKKDIEKYLPQNKSFRRYTLNEAEAGKTKLAGKVCDYLWSEVTINVDGSVVPCCGDAQGKYVFGNLKKQRIGEIWNNQKIVNFRKQVLKNKNKIDICKFCSGSSKELNIAEIKLR